MRPEEDWSTLDLSKTHLKPIRPFVAEVKEFPRYTRELVHLQWRPADPIYLFILKPKGAAKPPPVLYLYGYPTTLERFTHDSYCENVTGNGCAAVGFVSALTGERYRLRPMKEWFVSELQEALACTTHDVQLVLDYLATRGDLDMNRVGIFGQGSGGAIAILAAAADSRVKALDLLNPWGDWPRWMAQSGLVPEAERPRYITPEFQQKVGPLDPLIWLPRLKSQKIRLQFVRSDRVTPQACRENLTKAAPQGTTIETFEDTLAHFRAVSAGRLFAWIGKQLGAAATGAAAASRPAPEVPQPPGR
jgi:hypothetical protein